MLKFFKGSYVLELIHLICFQVLSHSEVVEPVQLATTECMTKVFTNQNPGITFFGVEKLMRGMKIISDI